MIIDFHTHVVHPELARLTGNRNVMHGWGTRERPPQTASRSSGRSASMSSPDSVIADMDRLGIDRYVLSASMIAQNSAWATPSEQVEFEAKSNERVAEWVAGNPDRFVGLATLPLKDTNFAIAELERATTTLPISGVNMPALMDGDYLGAPRFHPLWEAIRERDLPVFIHPDGARDLFYQQYSLWNSVGQPVEEAKLLGSLILEGVLERYPGLKIVISHGGGYLPHYTGRLDRNVTNMPESVVNISRKPSEYLHELYFDTCLYDVGILEALVNRYGADHIVMGSDYPVGERDPIGFVRQASNLDERGVEQVLGANAASLLGLA